MKNMNCIIKIKTTIFTIVAFAILGPIIGCSQSIENAIVGKWQDTKTFDIIEFFSDHTFAVTSKSNGSFSGKWSKIDKDRFKLDAVAFGTSGIVTMDKIVIVGDELKAVAAGEPLNARRIKNGDSAAIPSNLPSSADEAAARRNAQNLASIASAVRAAGYNTRWASKEAAVEELQKGISVNNQGPFRVDFQSPDQIAPALKYLRLQENDLVYIP